MPDEIRRCWRMLVEENDFLSKVISAIRIRNGMDQQTLESHIAYSAGQPKKPQFMTGARTVIEILRATELVRESDGKYVAIPPSVTEDIGVAPPQNLLIDAEQQRPAVKLGTVKSLSVAQGGGLSVTININIACAPADLRVLGEELSTIIRNLEHRSTEKSDS